MFTLITLTSFAQSETGVRVFSGKCDMTQTGGDADEWFLSITNFNSVAGDASDIQVGDFVYLNDAGVVYLLEITLISSASGSSASLRVSKVGITGISSVPTTSGAITARTTNFGLFPFFANMSDNNNQLAQEYMVYLIDSIMALGDGSFFATLDTAVFSPSGKTPENGDFAQWQNRGQMLELKNDWWNRTTAKNASQVNSNNKVTVAYGALGQTTYNLNSGNYFYTSANGNITLNVSNEVSQNTNDSWVFEVFNNTEDAIAVSFESGVFTPFGTDDGIFGDMPNMQISAFGTRIFKFVLVNLGEIAYLVSDDDIGSFAQSGSYTPTITKNVASDTIVTVYSNQYFRMGNNCIIMGKVLLNNASGTIASSFRVSYPPGITSTLDDIEDDVTGNVTNQRQTTPAVLYGADSYADVINNRVTISYDTDNATGTRQLIEYTVAFKIK